LDRHVIDEVLFAAPLNELHRVSPYIAVCEEVGVTASVPAQHNHSTPVVVDLHGVPLLSFAPARHLPELLVVKRIMDVVTAAFALALLSPVLLACAIAIRLQERGPVLFRQTRVGLYGRPFGMLKFRTMHVGAELRQSEVRHLNESDGP